MRKLLLSAALIVVSSAAAFAETIEIQMLNVNEAGNKMVFSQELIRAELGDVIKFVPTDKSHNAQSVKNALPDDQKKFKGKMNKEIEYLVTEAGLTAVVCQPHQTMGMVALIVVGNDVSNAQDILDAGVRGKGKIKIAALIEEAIATQP
jgi:pseudoazurin